MRRLSEAHFRYRLTSAEDLDGLGPAEVRAVMRENTGRLLGLDAVL